MAVRAEGREIQLHLRPPDLGQLAIRVVVHDGVLQAHIAADRPEAARLLEQSLGHLQDILAERGYELGSVDVEAGGPEAGGAGSGAAGDPGGDRRGRERADGPQEPAGTPAPVAAPVHGGDVDLLA
jgi:flagellar hook-length control protein FliK